MTTQQYKYDTYLRSGNYPEIEALVQYLVHGKESDIYIQQTTNTAQRARTDRIGRIIVACGWKEEMVSRWFENMTDFMIPFQHDQDFVEAFLKEIVSQETQMDRLRDCMRRIGLREEYVQEIQRVMSPLEDSCYTDSQMADVSIEYLTGGYKPITPTITTDPVVQSLHRAWDSYESEEESPSEGDA
jgi:hypothetical protein